MSSIPKKIKHWCIGGFIALVVLGSVLHFLYEWLDYKIIALIAPMNESVWEHLKLGYWAMIIFSIPEYIQLRRDVNNYFFIKLLGVLIITVVVLIVYYSYSFFIERNIVALDIFSYVLGALLCQMLTCRLYQSTEKRTLNIISLIFLILIEIIFAVLTFSPPHKEIFKDRRNDTYGIHKLK